MATPSSKKANYSLHYAPDDCHIWLMCKDRLIFVREKIKEIMEESKIYVAVGKEMKERESTLNWALKKFKKETICVIYVHVPAQLIPMSNGFKAPSHSLRETHVLAFHDREKQEAVDILDDCTRRCDEVKIHCESIYIKKQSVAEGISELISQLRITKLVMGAAANSGYSRKMTRPTSKKANYVLHHAPNYCQIWFICKDRLIFTRESVKQLTPGIRESQPNRVSYSAPSTPAVSIGSSSPQTLGQRFRNIKHTSHFLFKYWKSVKQLTPGIGESQPNRVSYSAPSTSADSIGSSSPQTLGSSSPRTSSMHHGSPSNTLLATLRNDSMRYKLQQSLEKSEQLADAARTESEKRQKAEEETMEALEKVREAERKQAQVEKDHRSTKIQLDKVSKKFVWASDQILSLHKQNEEGNFKKGELEEKLVSVEKSRKKYKKQRDKLRIERNIALRVARESMNQRIEGLSSSYDPMFSCKFSPIDLEKATKCFDPSLIIGKGGYGTVYKGFLRHTEIAIKIPQSDSLQGLLEFKQEADVLLKLRHPNLVTLLGTCTESWALIYEYLPTGSLEDRLKCKDDTLPIPWQVRIRIATELCSVLNFLHSSQPNSIIHADLNPKNVLLDANLVCKLSGFGFCHVLPNDSQSVITEPKGTHSYWDPEFLETGLLTQKSDTYSFGVILLCLLTGKSDLDIVKEVQDALDGDYLRCVLDETAGDWPFVRAKQLAYIALKCCDREGKNRPDLASEVWSILKPVHAPSGSLSSPLRLVKEDQIPSHFICPILHEIMHDPQFAADGFTYEANALKGWLEGGHDTSPMTNLKLAHRKLTPNRALRSTIQEWLQLHQRV